MNFGESPLVAIIRKLEVIGEAVKNLAENAKQRHSGPAFDCPLGFEAREIDDHKAE